MLFTNQAGKRLAPVVILLIITAIVVGFLSLPHGTLMNQPITTGCVESPSGALVREQTGNFPGWEWAAIAALVGVVIGMTVGIVLTRPPLTS